MVQGKKGRISLLLCRMYFLLFYSEEIRMSEPILVLSHNAALSGLIARTLRWREVYSTILPVSTPLSALRERSVRGVILAGDTPEDTLLDEIDPEILKSGLPVLALGSAAPLLCRWHGGSFRPWEKTETSSAITFSDIPLFREIASGDRMLHHYAALSMADGLVPIAEADGSVVGFRHETLPHFGIQYPIERHDPDGALLLTNFALEICGAKADWNMDTIIDLALDEIRQDASSDGKILCAVSGGVDSAVCTRLVSLAAGARLRCILVDNGMFHEGEPELIQREFLENLGISLERIDAQAEFLEAIRGVTDEKRKAKIISERMIQVLARQINDDPEVRTVVLGMNFNDVLFGQTPVAALQNATSVRQPIYLQPLQNLFKDEVRRLAQSLSLPGSLCLRQPFPTSGLASRIFGEVTEKRLQLVRAADACLAEEIAESGFERKLWQYYSVLCQSPDMPGWYTIVLRALQAGRTTATSARLPFDLLERVSQRMLRELPGVSRVVYDLTPSRHYGEQE